MNKPRKTTKKVTKKVAKKNAVKKPAAKRNAAQTLFKDQHCVVVKRGSTLEIRTK